MTSLDPSAQNSTPKPRPFLPARTLLILLAGVVIGLGAGMLAFLGGVPTAAAVLAGLSAAGTAVPVLHQLID